MRLSRSEVLLAVSSALLLRVALFASSLAQAPDARAFADRRTLAGLPHALDVLFEVNDHLLFRASGELLSGHTLKHVVAACAAWPVIAAVRVTATGQNGPHAVPLAAAQ